VGSSAAQAAPTTVTPAAAGATVEFIVREDNGNTVSVVQVNGDNLRPGDRVVLRRSAHIRVVRAPPN
jgi:outer membrane lipoprotein SlyB